jgi:hypothetical protein
MNEMNPIRFAHNWNHGIMGSGQLGKWFKKTSQSGSTFKTRFFKGKIFIDAENNE